MSIVATTLIVVVELLRSRSRVSTAMFLAMNSLQPLLSTLSPIP